jgi:hypothetical protein
MDLSRSRARTVLTASSRQVRDRHGSFSTAYRSVCRGPFRHPSTQFDTAPLIDSERNCADRATGVAACESREAAELWMAEFLTISGGFDA